MVHLVGRGRRQRCNGSNTWCDCRYHQNVRARAQREINEDRSSSGSTTGWTPSRDEPPAVGFVDGHHLASFKTGYGANAEHTLIADGDYSDDKDGFNNNHNHYGRRGEGDGYFSKDRGYYTGPDA